MKHVSLDARRYTAVALQTLVELCSAGKSELARIAAAKEILIRGWDNAPPELDEEQLARAAEKILEGRRMKALPPAESRPTLVVNASEAYAVAKK